MTRLHVRSLFDEFYQIYRSIHANFYLATLKTRRSELGYK